MLIFYEQLLIIERAHFCALN